MRRDRAEPHDRPNSIVHDSIVHAVVVVPAHDEVERIGLTLDSIERAAAHREVRVSVSAIVVLDTCEDATDEVVRSHVEVGGPVEWHVVPATVRRASSARQAGLDELVGTMRRSVAPSRTAVLSTDADTVVPHDWIVRHVQALDSGLDGVAGIVDLTPDAGSDLGLDAWRSEYESSFRVDGTHAHVHAANLCVRLDVLLAAGGFGHLRRAEDIDLWRRLTSIESVRLCSDQSIVVRTSDRPDGRVEGGFATALARFRSTSGLMESTRSATPHVETERLVSE
ncbi:MAG: glycosyltransferase [Ilumatobacter sp.]|uniref:glycosyltransferase n=1 Tax=Ilumatobacter sp. TaxID=1967498 RepID=UPI0032974111